jgi:hypothetical protein
MSRAMERKQRLGPLRKTILATALVVLSLGAVELSFRAYLWIAGRPATPQALRAEIRDLTSWITEQAAAADEADELPLIHQGLIIHPFTGYELASASAEVEEELALFRSPSRGDEFIVLLLGGSVAARFGRAADLFEPLLEADPRLGGRKARLLGHGRAGFRQPQQATLLAYLLASGFRPDAVVNIDGFNEVAVGMYNVHNAASPIYPSIAHWGRLVESSRDRTEVLPDLFAMMDMQRRARDAAARADRWRLHRSAVLGTLTGLELQRIKTEYAAAYERYTAWLTQGSGSGAGSGIAGPAFSGTDDQALDYLVESWVASSLNIDAMCRVWSVPYLHVLQPTLFDPGAKPATDEEIRKGTAIKSWRIGVEGGYPRLRAASQRLVERGVAFADLSMLFAAETRTIYIDACHYNTIGQVEFSAAVGRALLDVLGKR